MGLCNSMEKRALDRVLGQDTSWTQPTGTYLALSRSIPQDTLSGFDEPTIGQYGYSRVLLRSSGTIDWSLPAVSGGIPGTYETHNLNALAFNRAVDGNWGVITHFVIFDHISSSVEDRGLVWGPLNVSKDVKIGDIVRFSAGHLVVQVG